MIRSARRNNSISAQTWVLALTSVASLMVALDALVVATALSTIRRSVGATIEQLEWTVNAYTLSFAVLMMTAAALGDRLGRRRLFAAGLGLFTTASAACALAPNIGLLIAARAVQGAGAAFVMPLALSLLSAAFAPERRAWALGIFSSVTGLAVLGGPVVGGAIAQGIGWQWIFWLNVPIGLLTILLVGRRMQESFGPKIALDIPGLALVTGAALGVAWGLVRGNPAGWGSAEVIGALATGVALGAAFVAWELRTKEPMLPMRFFRSRAFSSGNAATFFLFGSLFGAVFFMAQFLQAAQHHGPLDAGLRLLPWTATLGGLLLQTVGMGWIALIAEPDLAYRAMVVPMVVAGVGVSMAVPATQSSVVSSVAPQYIGKASATFSTLRQLGGAFGVAIVVAVFAGAGSYASAAAFSDGFVLAIAASAGLSLAGALAGIALPRREATAVSPAPQAVEIEAVS
jgi:MFS family permease